MQVSPIPNITIQDPNDTGAIDVLNGMMGIIGGMKKQYTRCAEEKELYRQQAEAAQITPTNIIAEGKQKELIAIMNSIYEAGYVTGCNKGEFMSRALSAFGIPETKQYNSALSNIMIAKKYEDIFTNLKDAAIAARDRTLDKH